MTTYWDARTTEPTPPQQQEEVSVEQKQETPQTEESVSTIEATVETVIEAPIETGVEITSVGETDYIGKRLMAYRQNSLDMEDIQELVMEYIVALAAEDIQVAAKYKTLLSAVHNKRQSIKQQFPKS